MVKTLLWALLGLMILITGPAMASGHNGMYRQMHDLTGMTVPAMAMNELPMYRTVQPEVLRLAATYATGTTDDARRVAALMGFIQQQDAALQVGGNVWYGAWDDERHPQHPPIHAVLAGTKMLLQLMHQMMPGDASVNALMRAATPTEAPVLCTSARPMTWDVVTVTPAQLGGYYATRLAEAMQQHPLMLTCLAVMLLGLLGVGASYLPVVRRRLA